MNTITIDNKQYSTTDQAEQTNRSFHNSHNAVSRGDHYMDEWALIAGDDQGNPVRIVWQFDQVKGDEIEPSCLDWCDDNNVVSTLPV